MNRSLTLGSGGNHNSVNNSDLLGIENSKSKIKWGGRGGVGTRRRATTRCRPDSLKKKKKVGKSREKK